MKKRVLFVTNPMWVGGIEKSLLAVFSLLDPNEYDVTLMLTKMAGHMLGQVPGWIKKVELPLCPLDRYAFDHGRVPTLKHCLRTGHWFYAVRMLWQRLLWDVHGRNYTFDFQQAAAMVKRADVSKIETNYDFAFAYAGGYWSTSVVRYMVKAPVTAMFIHDESACGRFHERDVREVFAHFTHRYGDSFQLTDMLNHSYVRWGAEFETMPYVIDFDSYRKCADKKPEAAFGDEKRMKFLTVGRLCAQKGIDHAIEVASRLKKDGYDFCWYVIGYGDRDEMILRRLMAEYDVEDCFVLLGKKDNPYPYFRDCDLYLQPSRFEAFCITISEAKAFYKPIVATDFAGARDQLTDGETGLITPLNNPDAFYVAVKRLLDDSHLREHFSKRLHVEETDGASSAKVKWGELLGDVGKHCS